VLVILRQREQRLAEGVAAIRQVGAPFDQQLHDPSMPFTYGEMDRRRVVVFDERQRRGARNQPAHPFHIAAARRHEHCVGVVGRHNRAVRERVRTAGAQLHRADQRARQRPFASDTANVLDEALPAGEPVRAGNELLRGRQRDVSGARQILGLFAKLFERRTRRERTHGISFHHARVRPSG
jgi:hypothetical protein